MLSKEELEILDIVKSIKDTKGKIYDKNKDKIDKLNQLIDLQDKVNKVLKEYNLPLPEEQFKDIGEHLGHLSEKGIYKVSKTADTFFIFDGTEKMLSNKIISTIEGEYTLYHGTSIESAKKILINGYFKARKDDIDRIQYNKVFFASTKEYSGIYGLLGGVYTYNTGDTTQHIIFQCNLNNPYTYIAGREYFMWGDVGTDVIQKIYLCDKFEVLRELSKEELLEMGESVDGKDK